VRALEQLFTEKSKNFEKYGQAFINGTSASWGDTFVFLKEANKDKWLVLILQSKRRASKENQSPVQETVKELNKVFGTDHQAWTKSNFDHLLLLITDCNSAKPIPNDLKQHVCVITRKEHKEFYGEYRQKLRDLRDFSPMPKKDVQRLKAYESKSEKEDQDDDSKGIKKRKSSPDQFVKKEKEIKKQRL